MSPERLKERAQQFADNRQGKYDRATKERDRKFKRRVQFERTNS